VPMRAVETRLGRMVLESSAIGLRRWGWSDEHCEPSDCPHLNSAAVWLQGYFDAVPMPEPALDRRSMTPFAVAVCEVLALIAPPGTTTTYGEVAAAVGRPMAQRAVGAVMARNPLPLLVPCHRVLPSAGGIGAYSAAEGARTKLWLLEHERRTRNGVDG